MSEQIIPHFSFLKRKVVSQTVSNAKEKAIKLFSMSLIWVDKYLLLKLIWYHVTFFFNKIICLKINVSNNVNSLRIFFLFFITLSFPCFLLLPFRYFYFIFLSTLLFYYHLFLFISFFPLFSFFPSLYVFTFFCFFSLLFMFFHFFLPFLIFLQKKKNNGK